jgi:hypothetical protein
MPGPSDIARGNIAFSFVLGVPFTPALIVLNTTAEQLFTVPGIQVGDVIAVNKPTTQAGLGIVNTRVSAANQIGITFSNNTGSSIIPTAGEVYVITVDRPSNLPFPTAIT